MHRSAHYQDLILQTVLVTLHKPATDKAVHWDEGVIDNEHMGKKTSKCNSRITRHNLLSLLLLGCCIYHKPRDFGESSSSDDSDDDKCGCHEHRVAKKKMKRTKNN